MRLAQPRLTIIALLALVATGLLGAAFYAVMADDDSADKDGPVFGGITAVPFPSTAEERPGVTTEDLDAALASLAASSTFTTLTRDVDWSVSVQLPNIVDGEKDGIGLILELTSLVDSDGPWLALHCRGTVTQEFLYGYRGIQTVSAVFDSDGKLIALQPLGFQGGDPDSEVVPAPSVHRGSKTRTSSHQDAPELLLHVEVLIALTLTLSQGARGHARGL